MIYFVAGIIWCAVWGIIVNKVIENKGYEESWFWWGFFFGIFALIAALAKPYAEEEDFEKPILLQREPIKRTETIANGVFADKVDICSAVHILSWEILKEEDSQPVLSVEFLNVSESTISAAMFSVVGFNAFGDKVSVNGGEPFDVIAQDISIMPGAHGTIQNVLPNADIRKADIAVKKICFSDGTVEENKVSRWIDTKQEPLPDRYLECVRRKNPQGQCYAVSQNDYWQCVCGFVNTGRVCRVCDMRKDRAFLFTRNAIENTYKEYLEVLAEEAKIVEERKIEVEKIAQEKENAQKKRKRKHITLAVTAVCIAVVTGIGIFVFNNAKKERQYKEEKQAISEQIKNGEYDSAFSVMISSDSYDELAEEYDEVLWEKQNELDKKFAANSWSYVLDADDMVYDEKAARDGFCYYELLTEEDSGSKRALYAISEDGEKINLYSRFCQTEDEYVSFYGLGYDSGEVDDYSTMWSRDWFFITVRDHDVFGTSTSQYAIKYNKERDMVFHAQVSEEVKSGCDYAKMKDGNILISSQEIGNIREAEEIKLFDVVKGKVKKITYHKLEKKYNGDIEGNILTMFK